MLKQPLVDFCRLCAGKMQVLDTLELNSGTGGTVDWLQHKRREPCEESVELQITR